MSATQDPQLLHTPLHGLHLELGARMVPFAGYSMPVQYPAGLMAEHHQTRESAGLFDVSHMGQLRLVGPDAAAAFETLMPVDVIDLPVGKQRYGLLLTDEGTIIDDLMFVNCGEDMSFAGPPQEAKAPSGGSEPSSERGGTIFVIVNGACKLGDIAHIQGRIGSRCQVIPMPERGLLALQGPKAVQALVRLVPGVDKLVFMTGGRFPWNGGELFITRSGYTGEDGFEISVHESQADALARALLAQPEVKPIGLGARNSLRLEAGLCLYGNDIDTTTTPVEAALNWAIQKVRRTGGARAGGFPGAAKVLGQLDGTVPLERKRVGLAALERVPVREHTELQDTNGARIGEVTSGLLGPTINRPVAMGYVNPLLATIGTRVHALVRGKPVAMEVSAMPFVPNRYWRG
ncbi:MAG: glycine cleavage system aminomethyltransferase GcvT [Ramlibacter sp.]|nr:glycine cleavage system aminomethyltransferase GcvT [Ramlibacter sp.]